ncbi:MAG: TraB/GumN family protein [Gilvibacter sp.]
MKNVYTIFNFNISFKLAILVTIILLSVTTSFSQEKPNHNLLWKIKHKNSDKISYLFGTMHLQDKRVFNFGDSLLPALKRSEAFALEVHPDSIQKYYNGSSDYDEGINLFKEALSEEEYKRFDDRFKQINSVSIDSFYTRNPLVITSMFVEDVKRKDDMRVFLDTYLYSVAVNNDKHLIGLEKPEHYDIAGSELSVAQVKASALEVMEYNDQEIAKELEKMVAIYANGNLDELHQYLLDYQQYDALHTERNRIMFEGMKSTMATKTLFTAVGAAHLTGDDGLISLFANEGYVISAVKNTFNNTQDLALEELLIRDWQVAVHPEFGVALKLPGKPIKKENSNSLQAFTLFDHLSGSTFQYKYFDFTNVGLDSTAVLPAFLENLKANELIEVTSENTREINGNTFLDLILKEGNNYSRTLLAYANNLLYEFSIYTVLSELDSAYSNAFFDSIEIKKLPAKARQLEEKDVVWKEFSNAQAAFSVQVPDLELKDLSRKITNPINAKDEPYELALWLITDMANKRNYLIRYNDQPGGYYLKEAKDIKNQFSEEIATKGKLIGEPIEIKMEGIFGYSFELLTLNKFHTIMNVFVRGNRTYVLMEQQLQEGTKTDRNSKFLSSLKFLDYLEPEANKEIKFENFSVRMPENSADFGESFFLEEGEDLGEFTSMTGKHSVSVSTGGVYLVQSNELSKYFRTLDIQNYYKELYDSLQDYGDSINYIKDRIFDGIAAKEALITSSENFLKQYIYLVPIENKIYLFYSYIGEEEERLDYHTLLVKTIKVNKKLEPIDWTASKAQLIFEDLKNPNDLISSAAMGAFYYHPFDKKDLDILEENLEANFKIDTVNFVREEVIGNLATHGGKKQLDLILDFYHRETTSETDKIIVLFNLLNFEKLDADHILMDLLANNPPKRESFSYPVLYNFLDSTAVATKHADRLIALYEEDRFKDILLSYFTTYAADDPALLERFDGLLPKFYEDLPLVVNAFKDSTSTHSVRFPYAEGMLDDYYLLASVDSLVDSDKRQLIYSSLYSLNEPNYWTSARALLDAIALNMTIDKETLQTYLTHLYTRYEVMEALVSQDKKQLIPSEYFKPEQAGKVSVFNYAFEIENMSGSPKLLGQVTYHNDSYNVFVFGDNSNVDDGNSSLYVCLNKGFDTDNMSQLEVFTDWEKAQKDWKAQALRILQQTASSD